MRDELERSKSESPAEAPLWRVKVDGVQVGAYFTPSPAVQQAVERGTQTITLERL